MEFYHNKLGWGVLTELPELKSVADSCSYFDDYNEWFALKAFNHNALTGFIDANLDKFQILPKVNSNQKLYIIDDNLVEGEIVSNLDGKVYTSKSKHRKALKSAGMIMIEPGVQGQKKQDDGWIKNNEREVRDYLKYQIEGV